MHRKLYQSNAVREGSLRIVVVAGLDRSLVNFRGALMEEMVQAGYEVIAVAPLEDSRVHGQLGAMGVRYVPIALERAGVNILADLKCIWKYRMLFRDLRPDVVLCYTVKPVIYASFAAWSVNVPRIYALITGLGTGFYTIGVKGWLLRCLVSNMYRCGLRCCSKAMVQNHDLKEYLVKNRIVPLERVSVVRGSGVDIRHFSVVPLPVGPCRFLYVGRLLRDKGIGELVAAVRILKIRNRDLVVSLVGDVDTNPTSFTRDEIEGWRREGLLEWYGYQEDVRPYLRNCTVFVLPSYHEGLSRSTLEAMAVGRAVITTDAIGCRETIFGVKSADNQGVRLGENGFLVPVKSVDGLVAAMERFVLDPQLAISMGAEGRRLAEEYYDVRKVNEDMLRFMELTTTPVVNKR